MYVTVLINWRCVFLIKLQCGSRRRTSVVWSVGDRCTESRDQMAVSRRTRSASSCAVLYLYQHEAAAAASVATAAAGRDVLHERRCRSRVDESSQVQMRRSWVPRCDVTVRLRVAGRQQRNFHTWLLRASFSAPHLRPDERTVAPEGSRQRRRRAPSVGDWSN